MDSTTSTPITSITLAVFHNLVCKLMNKFISHGFLSYIMFLYEIRPTVKNSAGNKICSSVYRPVLNRRNLLKLVIKVINYP